MDVIFLTQKQDILASHHHNNGPETFVAYLVDCTKDSKKPSPLGINMTTQEIVMKDQQHKKHATNNKLQSGVKGHEFTPNTEQAVIITEQRLVYVLWVKGSFLWTVTLYNENVQENLLLKINLSLFLYRHKFNINHA